MRKNYFLSLLLLMIAYWNVEAKEREISLKSTKTYIPAKAPLPTPTELVANSVFGSTTSVDLTWQDNASGETSFQIAISVDGVHFISTSADATLSDLGLKRLDNLLPNTKYWFAVRAVKDDEGPTDLSGCSASAVDLIDDLTKQYSCWSAIYEYNNAPLLPLAPTNVGVVDGWTQTSATLVFRDASTNELQFLIRRSIEGGPFVDLALIPTKSTPGTGEMSYTDNTLIPNVTYRYEILASNATGLSTESALSPIFASLPPPPAAPSFLQSPRQTLTTIYIEFLDNSDNEDNFEIERSSDGVNFYVHTPDWFANQGYFTDTHVTAGNTYFYRVRAKNRGGYSAYSNTIKVVAKIKVAPPAPYDLQAKSISPTQIDLNWSNQIFDEYSIPKSIEIYRSSISATEGFLPLPNKSGIIQPQRFTFSDTGLSPKTKYWYKLLSANDIGQSPYSNIVSATTLGPPSAPSNLTAISTKDSLGNDIIVTQWIDTSDDEEKFIIERATDVNFTKNLLTTTLFSNRTSATSIPFEEGVTYFFRAKAINKYGESKYSNVRTITPFYTVIPNKPYGLKATAASKSVSLKWGDDSNKEETFEIERSTNGISFAKIGSAARNEVTFKDSLVTANTKYWYRVKAVNSKGSSAYSETVQITTPAATIGLVTEDKLITDETWQVYPNPTTDGVKLTLPESMKNQIAYVTVIDRMSREVIRVRLNANQAEYRLDLSNFSEGTYTISIRTAGKQISKRVYKY